MESLFKQNSQRLIVAILVLNLMMLAALIFFLRESFIDYRRQAQTTAENLSLSIEREVSDTFKVADVLLTSIAEEFEFLSHDLPHFTTILNARTGRLKRLSSLLVIDAEGAVIFGKNASAASIAHPLFKETLLRLQQDTANNMLVSRPLQEQTSGTWFLLLARRISSRDGSFAGAVTATVPLEYFQQMFAELKLGSMGSIALRDESLRLIVRHPSLVEGKQIGSSMISDDFRAAIIKNPNAGIYEVGITSLDGIKRLHSFRRNTTHGFFINVGIAKSDYLDEWEDHLIQSAVMFAAFSLSSLVLVRSLRRAWRKQDLEKMRRKESDDRFLTVFNNDPLPKAVCRASGFSFADVNEQFLVVCGYSRDELLGRSMSGIGMCSEAAMSVIMDVARSHPLAENPEIMIKRRDGYPLNCLVHAELITISGEQSLLITLQDISEKKLLDEKLRRLSRVAEQSPVAIVITDLAGNIEFVNPKFVQLTGYSIDEVIGRNPSLLQSGETARCVYEYLWQTILAGNVWEGDFCNKTKSGELFWEHSTISPLRNAEGQITHFIAIKEDITQKIEVMDQLLQSQKMQSIGQLAGGMAHDFNNILSIINGYICLMQLEMQEDDPVREYLAFIQEASSRAGGLTHALLAFSRKQIIKPKVQNLNAVLANVSVLLERTMRDDIVFRMFFEDDPLYVDVDSVQIDHVLINIATNAMDAMPDGGKFSMVSSRRIMDAEFISSKKFGEPGDYAAIELSDNGIGMDDETAKRVFEPFFTTKDVGKGTGLGMSMALGIVKQHNGFIEVSSQSGAGTTITLFLPLRSKAENEGDSAVPLQMGALPCGDETILLAEDEPNVRTLMHKLLTNCGYTVIIAEDGQDAVDKFNTCGRKIDLLFFDLIMPHKNGREAYIEIRNSCSDIKVLFNSGYPAGELHKLERLDMHAEFLPKPVHPMTLMTKIRSMLDS